MKRLTLTLAALLPLVACSAEQRCAATAAEDCADARGCVELTGRSVETDESGEACADYDTELEVLGCMAAEQDCGDALTLAAPADDPTDCSYWFTNTCIPADMVACDDWPDECSE
ncbi:MAG: hypothetical protein VX899_23555 [Myxococcota bacterium]|nr:hypothetical protein [Myxococcota bacterium]